MPPAVPVSAPAGSFRWRVAIIGAGITGLAAAQRLIARSPDVHVTLLEASDRVGGIIRTELCEGFLLEHGPDSFITNKPGALDLCREIGISGDLQSTDPRYRKSLVLFRGRAVPVPDGFQLMQPNSLWAVLRTPLLSVRGKLRFLSEVLVPRRTEQSDESLASFVTRRFGRETFERLVQPLVGGIYTADPDRLSLAATLPRFPAMEREYGSLIRAAWRQRRQRTAEPGDAETASGARYGLFAAPKQGLEFLATRTAAWLSESGRVSWEFGSRVQEVRPAADINPGRTTAVAGDCGGSSKADQHRRRWLVSDERQGVREFDAVIPTLTTEACALMMKDESLCPVRDALRAIQYASSAILISTHRLDDFQHVLDASGLVIPAVEQRRILAVSFSSRKFEGRAPAGQIVLRTFVGGATQPELVDLSDDQLYGLVMDELKSILGLKRPPLFHRLARYRNAMPQYHLGHQQRVATLEQAVRNFPGLALAGSSYTGVGIPDSIASGCSAAEGILRDLNSGENTRA